MGILPELTESPREPVKTYGEFLRFSFVFQQLQPIGQFLFPAVTLTLKANSPQRTVMLALPSFPAKVT